MASRIAPSPVKERKKPAVPLWALIILGVVIALAIIYCVLCAVAGGGDTFRSKVSVNGNSLGGMTQEEAITALNQNLDGVTQVNGQECASIQLDPKV